MSKLIRATAWGCFSLVSTNAEAVKGTIILSVLTNYYTGLFGWVHCHLVAGHETWMTWGTPEDCSVEKKPEFHVVSAQTGWQRGWLQPVLCTCCLFPRCLSQTAQELCCSSKVLPGPFLPQLWGPGAPGAQLGTADRALLDTISLLTPLHDTHFGRSSIWIIK